MLVCSPKKSAAMVVSILNEDCGLSTRRMKIDEKVNEVSESVGWFLEEVGLLCVD